MLSKRLMFLLGSALILSALPLFAQEQEDEKMNPEKQAEEQTEKLATALRLEDWQIFYIDSALRHDYAAMAVELQALARNQVENVDIYYATSDKWMEKIQAAFKKYFTEEQWKEYLKNGGAKVIRDREKRRAALAGEKYKKKKDKDFEK